MAKTNKTNQRQRQGLRQVLTAKVAQLTTYDPGGQSVAYSVASETSETKKVGGSPIHYCVTLYHKQQKLVLHFRPEFEITGVVQFRRVTGFHEEWN